jgi:gamma-glutamyltranspeptidase/glutathione hydrolase
MSSAIRPELSGTFGMVSATHSLAAQCAMAVLEEGGNAFDAAAAGGLVLQVVEPHLNGLGGEVPIILGNASAPRIDVICGQGPAPQSASIEAFRALGLDAIPGTGLLAACVPGAFGAWMTLLRDHGTLPLERVLRSAVGYAEQGYPIGRRAVEVISTMAAVFREQWPTSAETYLRNGLPRPGHSFRNPDLAGAYRRILDEARAAGPGREAQIDAAMRAFYSGFVAEAIDRFCKHQFMDSSGTPHRGLLSFADCDAFEARHEPAVEVDFAQWTVAKCGPWTQGPAFLQQLRLLEGVVQADIGFLSADHIHVVIESAKLAFADREAWYADPDFAEVPLDALLSRDYANARRELVGARASVDLRPGSPTGRAPRVPKRGAEAMADGHWRGSGVQAFGEVRGDTVHIACADGHGNLVACTPSGGWLQSSPVIPGLGFCLGTRAQIFNLDPDHPNRIQGGKRPRTTLTPSIALKDGEPCLAFGTPGGDQQDQWSLEFFLAHAVFGHDLQAAIQAPMFNTAHFPSSFAPHEAFPARLHIESRVGRRVIDELSRRGHDVVQEGPWSLGRLCAVGRNPETGILHAGADPRGGQGRAVGR